MNKTPDNLLCSAIIVVLMIFWGSCIAEEEISVPASNDTEITVARFPAEGKYLMVWLAPEYGFRSAHRSMAQMLTEQNIEVWQSNIVESLFLPQSTVSLKQLDGTYIADVIEYAYKTTGKRIIVAGDSYATGSALLGAHEWQRRQHTDRHLIGAVLFTPYTYAYIPPLGVEPEYMPIVSATNIPLMIYQAKGSATIGQFELLLSKLQQHNNPVYTRFVPNVMSLFYQEPPTAEMQIQAKALPGNIKMMITVLEKHDVPARPIPLQANAMIKSGIDVLLKEYKGKNGPIPIKLKDIDGNTFSKDDFAGQVTIINFWATWCPPCIEEIPSLNRLKKKMAGSSFELISINYAEDIKTIAEFMKSVNVEFPVLLDKNGKFAKQWNVISYPSTFIIDSKGVIRYGVNAAIEWDDPAVIQKLKALQ
jgi:thiol-disulfide isomerase/thioredoxin